MSLATFNFKIVNYIVYYRSGGEKTRSDTVVYKLLDYFIPMGRSSDGSNSL